MTARAHPLVVTPVVGMPEITAEHGLAGVARLVADALRAGGIELRDGDVLVLSSKVVSKALGLRTPADDKAAVVLGQSRRVVAERRTAESVTRIVEALAGPVMAAAGVDASNTGSDDLLLLPEDPDACARALHSELRSELLRLGSSPTGPTEVDRPDVAAGLPRVGLVLSDTAGRPWRAGQVDFALGAAGLPVLDDLRGTTDGDGRSLSVTVRCLADELAAAADLVKGKDRHVALAHVRGLHPNPSSSESTAGGVGAAGAAEGAGALVRTGPTDWFALGHYEAVRASLGVAAGSAEAERIGIPSTAAEPFDVRLTRAAALAVLGLETVTTTVELDRLELASDDLIALGTVLGRLHAALWAEHLTGTVDHTSGQPDRPTRPARATLQVRERP